MMLERVKNRYIDFKKTFFRLKDASEIKDNSDILVDAVIQRFEFTFELSWKLMKSYLKCYDAAIIA
ncbi:HI0074 family nucleotidyltransferase substrate-binding subunit [Clostridium tyrobutyricum]|uniref:HI0074 family nucleotidyltransferase substrate-binding subunit n=1 Tax=Clostridium tyrobutyricum TaxID=1519 RepID=UPI0020CCFAF6|nr:HI0074 family nucleotidyltransferase substrate-binding subunit [Clostridium tyrobutyricum]